MFTTKFNDSSVLITIILWDYLSLANEHVDRLSSITRYDYNLTIMKSPKPATDTIYPHIKC